MTFGPLFLENMARAKALLLLCLACSLAAQGADTSYFETVAGSNQVGDGGPAQSAQISDCQGVAVDRFGAIYIADPDNHRVRRVRLQEQGAPQ